MNTFFYTNIIVNYQVKINDLNVIVIYFILLFHTVAKHGKDSSTI